ncbi:MAG: hypothetical protein Athens041674_100 [Parcubacteria group bacterium Athens0416_74]|nr:MAG: hypothetical protein Athens041674_100 [Parcubacteria group bacterium Athens0416_74]
MQRKDFLARLDSRNPGYPRLAELFESSSFDIRLFRKDGNIVEIVRKLVYDGLPPVIDRRFRLIIGIGSHLMVRAELYRYHCAIPYDETLNTENMIRAYDLDADAYTDKGFGYHFSMMRQPGIPYAPKFGLEYRPDNLDRELFLAYDTEA